MPKIRNAVDTAKEKCSCGGSTSWVEHWKRKRNWSKSTRELFTAYCRNVACWNINAGGSHVHKSGTNDDKTMYIVPLCDKCNQIPPDQDINISSYNYLEPVECD